VITHMPTYGADIFLFLKRLFQRETIETLNKEVTREIHDCVMERGLYASQEIYDALEEQDVERRCANIKHYVLLYLLSSHLDLDTVFVSVQQVPPVDKFQHSFVIRCAYYSPQFETNGYADYYLTV